MSRLKVQLRSQQVQSVDLNPEKEYIVGRKEDCDIVLQPEKGISREHFKLSFNGSTWNVEVVSRYGEMIVQGENVGTLSLQDGSRFAVPPYEFIYEESEVAPVATNAVHDSSYQEDVEISAQNEEPNFDKTVVGAAPLVPYIKIVDDSNDVKEMLRLDAGDSWVAGRDLSCHIQIRDQRVSRRQFEIRKVNSQFMITDLGSVNGTLLNGNPISASEPTPIKSGDAISVLSNYLYFELHDGAFQSKLDVVKANPPAILAPLEQQESHLPAAVANPHHLMPYSHQPGMSPVPYQPQSYPLTNGQPPTPMSPGPLVANGKFDFEKHRPKLIVGAVLLLLVVYLFADTDSKPAASPTGSLVAAGSPQDIFNKLNAEQQALVKQRYKDAKNLYMQGKYQLAQDEIVKIYDLVPDFEDIKEIERLSKEAIFIQEQQRRQEQLEIARQETEEKIQKQTVICQKKISPKITMADLDECLSSILEFNPEHPRIMELRAQVESIEVQRDAKAAQKQAHAELVSQLASLYKKAESVHKNGKPLDAIAAYQKVLASKLPDPNGFKKKSQRSIASIKKEMNAKTSSYQAEAEKYYQASNIKDAIMALRKAKVVDPGNPDIPEKIAKWTLELKKQMMALYQEGILEESFGNVEGGESKSGAKDRWRKIMELDIPDGEYYKKAVIKLKKYGAI